MKNKKLQRQKVNTNIMGYDYNKTFSENCIGLVTQPFQQMANDIMRNPTPDNIQLSRFIYDSTYMVFKTKLYSDINSLLFGFATVMLQCAKKFNSEERYQLFEHDLTFKMNKIIGRMVGNILCDVPAFDVSFIDDICVSESLYYANMIKAEMIPIVNEFLIPYGYEAYYQFMDELDTTLGHIVNMLSILIRRYTLDVFDVTNKIKMFTIGNEVPTIMEVFSYQSDGDE